VSGSELPFVACLCPTYKRPECLAASVALWLMQDYPADRRCLYILDDAGQFSRQDGEGPDGATWHLMATKLRFPSLQEKFNVIAKGAIGIPADILMPWEDDDVYLPHHISAHVAALTTGFRLPPDYDRSDILKPSLRHLEGLLPSWSRPSRVLTAVGSQPLQEEPALGRMHGAWAYTRERFEAVGGYNEAWDVARDQAFDFDLGQRLSGRANWWEADASGSPADPCEHAPISYVYHWGPAPYHGSGFGNDFYAKTAAVTARDDRFIGELVPKLDDRTKGILERAMAWPQNASQSSAK